MSTTRKFGMWIFLSVEVVLVGGLFVAYLMLRVRHPAAFAWSYRLLDRDLGALNTVILLLSSATMAGAVRCAQLSRRLGLALLLGLTLLGGASFLAVRSVEYAGKYEHHLLWGRRFQPDQRYLAERFAREASRTPASVARAAASQPPQPKPAAAGDAARGKPVFFGTCASCHGMEGGGIKSLGANLVASEFVGKLDDVTLLAFVKQGRQPFDPDSTLHLAMPAKGGNPTLTDQNLLDTIAFIRSLRVAATAKSELEATNKVTVAVAAVPATDPNAPRWVDGQWWVPRSVIPPAADGPTGLRRTLAPSADVLPPSDAHLFFGLYFVMTGLHGLHVVVGMGLIALLLVRSWRGRLGSAYLTGVYWHLVDAVWFLFFPLFYLAV